LFFYLPPQTTHATAFCRFRRESAEERRRPEMSLAKIAKTAKEDEEADKSELGRNSDLFAP
jgi:hypothetical protein